MESKLSEKREILIDELQELINTSEKEFLNLGLLYPRIIEEMNKSIEASQGASAEARGYLQRGGNSEQGFSERVNRLAKEGESIVAEANRNFSQMSEEDLKLVNELAGTIEHLGELDNLIERIKDDSIEMELVSLNALTVALKSGNAGKAFSVITDELKRLSAKTIGMTEDLTEKGRTLFSLFNDYKEKIKGLEDSRKELFQGITEKLGTSFQSIRDGIDEIAHTLSGLSEKSRGVREPILEIMESIQLQDIIRQSADHVILSLRELEDFSAEGDIHTKLDELAFYHTLAELAISLLEDIEQRLDSSIGLFKRNIDSVLGIISEGEKERQRFISRYQDSKGLLMFDASAGLIKSLVSDTANYLGSKNQLVVRGSQLTHSVDSLEGRFSSFAQVVKRFSTIDIASRIEVAKQSILKTMNDTVNAMSRLTVNIEKDVFGAVERTKTLIDKTQTTMQATTKVFATQEESIHAVSMALEANLSELTTLRGSIQECVGNFSLYTDDFVKLIRNSRDNMEKLDVILESIRGIREQLLGIKDFAQSEGQRLSGKTSDMGWSIQSDRLKEIIDRFTIFTHKKVAGNLGGFRVEEGVSTGEVTIF